MMLKRFKNKLIQLSKLNLLPMKKIKKTKKRKLILKSPNEMSELNEYFLILRGELYHIYKHLIQANKQTTKQIPN